MLTLRNNCLHILLIALVINSMHARTFGQAILRDQDVELAIEGLWSSDERERVSAKEKLIEIGARALPALLSTLEEIATNPEKPRFVLGKTEEGEKAWDESGDSSFGLDQVRSIAKLDITWRLGADVCEIMSRLRCIEAVPLLLKIMGKREVYTNIANMSFEMRALVRIGPPAISNIAELIESLESESHELSDAQSGVEQGGTYNKSEAAKIRARAAVVLGEIGNIQALPLLENLMKRSNGQEWRPDKPYVEEAIAKIKQKNQMK